MPPAVRWRRHQRSSSHDSGKTSGPADSRSSPTLPFLFLHGAALRAEEPAVNGVLILVVSAVVLLSSNLQQVRRSWAPRSIVYLVAVVISAGVTTLIIFPYNREMRDGIDDPARLKVVLRKWMRLTIMRVVFWSAEWTVMTLYFVLKLA